MKVIPPPKTPLVDSRKETPVKKGFKEIYKQKMEQKKEEPQIPPFNLYLPEPKFEISGESYVLELTHVITQAIEHQEISTEFTVRGTTIMIEQLGQEPGHLHIQITTQGDKFQLLQSHLGQLDLALKAALPHISCHLAPLQTHQVKNRFKNSTSSDMVKTRWMNGQKKFTP